MGCASTTHKEIYNKTMSDFAEVKTKKTLSKNEWDDLLKNNSSIDFNKMLPAKNDVVFSINFKKTPLKSVLEAIAIDTDYSLVFSDDNWDKEVSINLKNVTFEQSLKIIRDTYKVNYEFDGNVVKISPNVIKTKIFDVNYLVGSRQGKSETKVTSGSITDGNVANSNQQGGTTQPTTTPSNSQQRSVESSKITTTYQNDIWSNLSSTVKNMVERAGDKANVSIIQTSGQLVVTGFTSDLNEVEKLLKKLHHNIEKQVMIEAKIIEVALSDNYQSGINWASFDKMGRHRWSMGANTNMFSFPSGQPSSTATLTGDNGILNAVAITGASVTNNVMGLAFQTASFASLMQFLETQGQTYVLSSPRVSTLNNQKAVLKVGTDEFFVTNITSNNTTTGTSTTTSPTITLQPFFSGVALDVTPQIDDKDNIILHIRPSVSEVTEKEKNINLGTMGTYILPLASSTISESDSVIKAKDGFVVALGGLMKTYSKSSNTGLPGLKDIPVAGNLVKQDVKNAVKSELVILLKPTIIKNSNFETEIEKTRKSLERLN